LTSENDVVGLLGISASSLFVDIGSSLSKRAIRASSSARLSVTVFMGLSSFPGRGRHEVSGGIGLYPSLLEGGKRSSDDQAPTASSRATRTQRTSSVHASVCQPRGHLDTRATGSETRRYPRDGVHGKPPKECSAMTGVRQTNPENFGELIEHARVRTDVY